MSYKSRLLQLYPDARLAEYGYQSGLVHVVTNEQGPQRYKSGPWPQDKPSLAWKDAAERASAICCRDFSEEDAPPNIPDDLKEMYDDATAPGHGAWADSCATLIERIAKLEKELRKEWCLSHGHSVIDIYGDDGELQCARCMREYSGCWDFKRMDLNALREHVQFSRLAAARAAISSRRKREP